MQMIHAGTIDIAKHQAASASAFGHMRPIVWGHVGRYHETGRVVAIDGKAL